MKLIPLPALSDNYIWLLHNSHQALVVDPGDASVVLQALQTHGLQLSAILVTHHHADHVNGVQALRLATGAQVYGPAREPMPEPLTRLAQGQEVHALGLCFTVLEVPGHTAGHVAYYSADVDGTPLLFCAGCGRLFEGTPAQMLASLDQLAALPATTQVCCTHEYTLANLRFAQAVEPDNQALADFAAQAQALRAAQRPTLPSSIALERAINPFLRSRRSTVIQAVQARAPNAHDDVSVFAALRQWKNNFQ